MTTPLVAKELDKILETFRLNCDTWGYKEAVKRAKAQIEAYLSLELDEQDIKSRIDELKDLKAEVLYTIDNHKIDQALYLKVSSVFKNRQSQLKVKGDEDDV